MPRSRDKAQRDYVCGWESASRKPYPYKDVPPANSRKHSGPALRLRKLRQLFPALVPYSGGAGVYIA